MRILKLVILFQQ